MSAHFLTEAEARSLTERIRTQVNRNAKLMKQAWVGKVWVPLGYPSFADWLTATVGVTRQRAYQLIAIVTMTEVLTGALNLPATFTLTDSQTRSVIRRGSDLFIQEVRALLAEDAAPEERATVVRDELRRLARADRLVSTANCSAGPSATSTDVPPSGGNYTQPAVRNAANLTLVAEALHAHARSIGQMVHTDESRAQLSSALNVFRARMQQLRTEGGVLMLSLTEAKALTRAMKQNVNHISELMRQAWEGKVWVPLGYPSAQHWLREAVGVSRSYAYHLLATMQTEEKLREVTGSPNLLLSSSATRTIAAYGFNRFQEELTPLLTDDGKNNELQVVKLIAKVRGERETALQVVTSEPVIRDSWDAADAVEVITQLVSTLPTPEELRDLTEEEAAHVTQLLEAALRELEDAYMKVRIVNDLRTLKVANSPEVAERDAPKPFYPWVGGKKRIMRFVQDRFPDGFRDYYEPFLGGGAIALSMMHRYPEKTFHLSDLNAELISAWRAVKESPHELLEVLHEHHARSDAGYFARVRNLDRTGLVEHLSTVERGARFLYICKTAFSGIWCENSEGYCGSSYGAERPPVETSHIHRVSDLLNSRNVTLKAEGFEEALRKSQAGDLAYLDPPYATDDESGTATFSAYVGNGDVVGLQARVRVQMDAASRRGVFILSSNANTPATRQLFAEWSAARTGIRYTLAQGKRPVKAEMLFAPPVLSLS